MLVIKLVVCSFHLLFPISHSSLVAYILDGPAKDNHATTLRIILEMTGVTQVSSNKSFGGVQKVFSHERYHRQLCIF